jgi:hypothetical protein
VTKRLFPIDPQRSHHAGTRPSQPVCIKHNC